MFKRMDEWNDSPDLQSQYPTLTKYLRHVFQELGEAEQDKAIEDAKTTSANIFQNFVSSMSKPKDDEDELFI